MEKKYGVSIKWLAITAFEMRCGNMTVVTDPCVTECPATDLTWEDVEVCDIICLSHTHWDHITDIPRLAKKFRPKILCGDQAAMPLVKWLDYNPSLMYPMYPNTELDFGAVKICALYGRHTDQGKDFGELVGQIQCGEICRQDPQISDMQGLGSMEYRNFLFTLPNGTKILLWGNDPTVEQLNICKALAPDIAIIQRATKPEQIGPKADFAAAIGCKVLIPHHHHFKSTQDGWTSKALGEAFLERVPDGTFIDPVHGEWIHL